MSKYIILAFSGLFFCSNGGFITAEASSNRVIKGFDNNHIIEIPLTRKIRSPGSSSHLQRRRLEGSIIKSKPHEAEADLKNFYDTQYIMALYVGSKK